MNQVFYSILACITVCFMLINPQDISTSHNIHLKIFALIVKIKVDNCKSFAQCWYESPRSTTIVPYNSSMIYKQIFFPSLVKENRKT